jgi:hypothetical protein
MFGLFKRRKMLDAASSEWIFATWEWALRNFGSDRFRQVVLVQPINEHFPGLRAAPERLVEAVFERVRMFAGMQDRPCELRAQEADAITHVAPFVIMQGAPSGPAGTFRMAVGDGEAPPRAVITYNPDQANDPGALVATFAHELAHYLAHDCDEPPPGGEELHEHATDLLAVFQGFGIFLANSAFSFQQFQGAGSQGWSSRRQGYLSQYELTYALALFCLLKSMDRRGVERFLKESLVSVFRRSWKELEADPRLAHLRSMGSLG